MSKTRNPYVSCQAVFSLLLFFGSLAPCVAQSPARWVPQRGDSNDAPSLSRRDSQPYSDTARLDDSHGQVWRTYDIRAYTRRMRNEEKPEQPIIDWILRETGTNTWFGEVQSSLSSDSSRVVVYHTPQVQKVVKQTVDRFLNTRSEANEIAVRLITVNKPDWRVRVQSVLTPVTTQTPGVEAWLMSRENAALLVHELSRRNDFREHNSPNLTVYSGQSHTLEATRPRFFSTGGDPQSAFAPASNFVDEGFRLEINPLVSQDGQAIEAVVKCSVNQVEKLSSIRSTGVDQFGLYRQSQIQIPQVSSWQLHERFRWPKDEVLLISRGIVATPERATKWNEPIRRMMDNNGQRGNALLFLQSRSEVQSPVDQLRTAGRTDAANYRGRY